MKEKMKPQSNEFSDQATTTPVEDQPIESGDSQSDSNVEVLRNKVAALEENLLRAKADYQNLQRRNATERAEATLYANAELMKSLVTVLDDFDRALSGVSKDAASVVGGVRLVYANLKAALTGQGLEPIEALHRPFDPRIHEALMQQPSDEHPAGTVIEQLTQGYRLRDRVIRPARVVVSIGRQSEDDAAGVA